MVRILLTNDDGIGAPGLLALEETLADLGEVHVVAPLNEQSGTSRAITLRRPLRFVPKGPRRYAVEGTPADTVTMAVIQILDFTPDLVISGINSGPNLGENIYYSGTVADHAGLTAQLASALGFPVSLVARAGLLPSGLRRDLDQLIQPERRVVVFVQDARQQFPAEGWGLLSFRPSR